MSFRYLLRLGIRYSNNNCAFTRRIHTHSSKVETAWKLNKDDVSKFESMFPRIVVDITDAKDSALKSVMEYYKHMLEFNVPNGKKQRGLLALMTYKMITSQSQLTENQLNNVCILGWCMEIMQAASLMADDIMDQSITRRGNECWYRKENVGLANAVNDVYFLENSMYRLLKKHFQNDPCYLNLMELIYESAFGTISGQSMDLRLSKQGGIAFTEKNYESLCWHKTTMYTFYLPVATAMSLAGIVQKELFDKVEQILKPIGELFQMQDDYLDLFGDPSVTGKMGSDIRDGKCTWFIVNALQRLNNSDKELIQNWYGKDDAQLIQRVLGKFVELKLEKLYEERQKEMYQFITNSIKHLPHQLPGQLFLYCLNALYGRQS
ncbi:hypothetical protein CHUAL_013309 [Chamberlinius hualienensis]